MPPRPPTSTELRALRYIRNRIVHFGEPPSIRELQRELGYNSPRSAAKILDRLAELRLVKRRRDGQLQVLREHPGSRGNAQTIQVPLVGSAPCGAPMLGQENVEAMVPVSTRLARPSHRYFLLRATGDSMNKAGIHNGDLVLVRQQQAADRGDRVVALIDDEATIKEFHPGPEAVTLRPRSTNTKHKPIVLTTDFQVQGVVVATIPDWNKDK